MEDAPALGFQCAETPAGPLLPDCPVLPVLDPRRWRHAGNHEHRNDHAGHKASTPAQAAPSGGCQVGADDQGSKDGSQDEEAAPVSSKPSLGQLLVLSRCALPGLPGPPRLHHANQHVADDGAMWSEHESCMEHAAGHQVVICAQIGGRRPRGVAHPRLTIPNCDEKGVVRGVEVVSTSSGAERENRTGVWPAYGRWKTNCCVGCLSWGSG